MDAVPPGAVVKQLELPKHPPQAATCVAAGDFLTLEAASADLAENLRQAKREQARKAYEQAIALDPHCLQAYLSLAQLYVTMKDHADAEATYHKAAQLFPTEGASSSRWAAATAPRSNGSCPSTRSPAPWSWTRRIGPS